VPEVLPGLVSALCCYLGFALIALSQERHWSHVTGRDEAPARPRLNVALGAVLLFIALLLAIGSQGASFGSLLWVMLVSAGAVAVSFTLSWRPAVLRVIVFS
jgi:hypothetical protein